MQIISAVRSFTVQGTKSSNPNSAPVGLLIRLNLYEPAITSARYEADCVNGMQPFY